jgi:hypothetical protein
VSSTHLPDLPHDHRARLTSALTRETHGEHNAQWTALSLGFLLATTAAQAQTYPSKTITIVVTAAAGGVSDVVARAVGQRFSEAWGQQVVIEKQGRRRPHHRRAGRRQGAARRPHAVGGGGRHLCAQSDALSQGQACLGYRQGSHADHRARAHRDRLTFRCELWNRLIRIAFA